MMAKTLQKAKVEAKAKEDNKNKSDIKGLTCKLCHNKVIKQLPKGLNKGQNLAATQR